MQVKEFEALTLKECLQQVRSAMGPDAVILETRKFRKGGLLGLGARDAVAIVAATGVTVSSDLPRERPAARGESDADETTSSHTQSSAQLTDRATPNQQPEPARIGAAAKVAARGVYGRKPAEHSSKADPSAIVPAGQAESRWAKPELELDGRAAETPARTESALSSVAGERELPATINGATASKAANWEFGAVHSKPALGGAARLAFLESAIGEIRECLQALQREQCESHSRTVSAVVSAVAPAVTAANAAGYAALAESQQSLHPDLHARMTEMGVSDDLIQELFDQLPDMGAWSEQAQQALAVSAMRDLMGRRIPTGGQIELTPGRVKTVALIGPTGVGKTTTIAKLAAHYALMRNKRVALLTVDTYRIAAVEQLKTYSQIIGLPVSVAYSHAEVPAFVEQYADYDLILIDTAGRSQHHVMQVGELKSLLDAVLCETHLVLSASMKDKDMLEAAHRFSAARVDRLLFSKLDETSSYGTLLNVADRAGIPISYLTTGQKVPEDLEIADGKRLPA